MSGIPQVPASGRHEARPVFGTAYTTGPNANCGLPADLKREDHYPVTALCDCGQVIRMENLRQRGWAHTGRRPGDDKPTAPVTDPPQPKAQ